VLKWRQERLPRPVATWIRLLILAFFNSIGAWTILAWGQQHVDASLACVLNSTSPLFVFLFTALITRHETLNRLKLLGAVLGMSGVVMIVGTSAFSGVGSEIAG
jgi:drug/metabolite transporter (DMT)-like permease